jgi:hypothetical protein
MADTLKRTLQRLDTEAYREIDTWHARELSRGLELHRRHWRTVRGAGDALILRRADVDPSELEVKIVTDKLRELGWRVASAAPIKGHTAVWLTLERACTGCGGAIDAAAHLWGSGGVCSSCRAAERAGREPVRYIDPGDQERGSSRGAGAQRSAPAGPDLFGGGV